MRRAALLAALALAACVPVEPGPSGDGPIAAPADGELSSVDELSLAKLRLAGDDPFAVRPVEHILLAAGPVDPDGLALALSEAGFGPADMRAPRPTYEASVVLLSDTRARTLARQIGWLEANAPLFGYSRATWTTRPVVPDPVISEPAASQGAAPAGTG